MQDPLTGLELPGPELHQLLALPDVCCCLVDVDSLIWFNDQFGHAEGDFALAKLAHAVSAVAQQSDGRLFRVGGDEFLAVFPGKDRTAVLRLAAEIVACVRSLAIPYRRSDRPHRTRLDVNATVLSGTTARQGLGERGLTRGLREAVAEHTWRAKQHSQLDAGLVIDLLENR